MKCKLLRMNLLCFLLLFGVFTSVSFASIDYSNFTRFNYSGSTTDLTSYIMEDIWSIDITDFQTKLNTINDYPTKFQNFLSDLNNYSSIAWYVQKNTTAVNGKNILVHLSNNQFTGTSYGYSLNYSKSSSKTSCQTQSVLNNLSVDGATSSSQFTDKFLYNNNYYYGNNINISAPVSVLSFSPSSSDTISLTFNGVTENFIRYNFNQYSSNINLGNLENITGYREIQCNLYIMQANGNTFVYDNLGGFSYYSLYGINNAFLTGVDRGTYLSVQVNQSKLYKNQAYILKATGYRSDNSSSETTTNIYFLAYGDISSSGDPINPDADNPSIDWNLINSFNEFINSPSGNTDYIVNSELTNSSGDILGFHYSDYDQWGFGDFIKTSFNNFLDALYNYDNTSIDLGILGVHNSSEFIVSNNSLITIVSLFSNCFLLLSSIAWFFFTICAIGVLDLDKIIKDKADLGLF